MRVAVIGKSGQLARCLAGNVPAGVECVCLGRAQLDIGSAKPVFDALTSHCPDLVINASAYTAVDKAESDREAAFALNELGAARLAEFAAAHNIPLIHVSTDYVFDGVSSRPYTEDDATAPLNVYGESKLAGERAVARIWHAHIIVRTSWLFSAWGSNFVKTMLRLGAGSGSLRVVADQYGRPTSAHELANVLWAIAMRVGSASSPAGHWGIYHYAEDGVTNWAEFAEAIFASPHAGRAETPQVQKIGTVDYSTPARRPRNSVLDCSKIKRVFGIRPKPWTQSLSDVLQKIQ